MIIHRSNNMWVREMIHKCEAERGGGELRGGKKEEKCATKVSQVMIKLKIGYGLGHSRAIRTLSEDT